MNRRILTFTVLILIALVALSFAFVRKGERALVDFKVYYQAGERFLAGEGLYRASDGHYQFKYLPVSAALFAPLACLPYQAARFVWMLLVAAALVGVVWLSWRLLPRDCSPPRWVVVVTVLVMLKYYLRELELGQANAVVVVLLLAALAYLRNTRERLSGALFAVAIALKPYALIFLPYLVLKKLPRVWTTCCAVTIVLLLLPIFRYGPAAGWTLLGDWWHTVSGSTPQLLTNPDNVSVFGALAKWLGPDQLGVFLAAGGSALAIGGFFLWAMFRPLPVGDGESAWFATFTESAVLLVLIPLLSPQGWDYVFLGATPGIMLLLSRFGNFGGVRKGLSVAVLAVVGLSIYDLLGRSLYRAFMDASILTVCFVVIVGLLIQLRAESKTVDKTAPGSVP